MEFSALTLAEIFKTLAEPTRLQIVVALTPEWKWVNLLVEETGFPQPLVSHHLKVLRDRGIVRAERRGPFNYYCLASEAVWRTVEAARELAASLVEAENVDCAASCWERISDGPPVRATQRWAAANS